MSIALCLLGEVRWQQRAVVGERLQALLAALAAHGARPVRGEELVELVWGDDAPQNGLKSLQVLDPLLAKHDPAVAGECSTWPDRPFTCELERLKARRTCGAGSARAARASDLVGVLTSARPG